jgi:hypothetical protein
VVLLALSVLFLSVAYPVVMVEIGQYLNPGPANGDLTHNPNGSVNGSSDLPPGTNSTVGGWGPLPGGATPSAMPPGAAGGGERVSYPGPLLAGGGVTAGKVGSERGLSPERPGSPARGTEVGRCTTGS